MNGTLWSCYRVGNTPVIEQLTVVTWTARTANVERTAASAHRALIEHNARESFYDYNRAFGTTPALAIAASRAHWESENKWCRNQIAETDGFLSLLDAFHGRTFDATKAES